MSLSFTGIPGIGSLVGATYLSDPFVNFNISLTVELVYDIPVRAIKNLQQMNEYESIKEGGLNDYVHRRRKPISQPFTFEVERYVTSALTDPLSTGTELTLPVILWLDNWNNGGGGWSDSDTAKMFVFTGCTVMGRRYSEFNAEQSALAVETITIAYNHMYAIPNYVDILKSYFS